MALFEVEHFSVTFATHDGMVEAVKDVSFTVDEGECLGVVGESGSGKSQLFLGAMGLIASNGKVNGHVRYRGQEILGIGDARLNTIRGAGITMIFQDPLSSLTPHMTIGAQIREGLRVHRGLSREETEQRALEMLERVRIPEARRRLKQYPHELSGGMRQRAMIAMAAVVGPDLLIADEPTTALDVTVQAQILDIMRSLKAELNTAVVLISHDMGVIAGLADTVNVMKEGRIVERGPVDDVFYRPHDPYTKMLLSSMPRLDRASAAPPPPVANGNAPVVEICDVSIHFPIGSGRRRRVLRAVDGISLSLAQGETLGVVGESGCGKSTLARAILKLLPQTDGRIVWEGRDTSTLKDEAIRRLRKDFQIVFQDPLASLDARMTIGQSVAEPLRSLEPGLSRQQVQTRVADIMQAVELDPSWINRYPHEFSGGQNQRVAVARAMIVNPKLVVCDEAVSALDVSIQAQMIALIERLQAATRMSLIFISHDLSVVRRLSHRVMVLYLGRVVEVADRDSIYTNPRHPYTKALISAVPLPDPRAERNKPRIKLSGDIPSPLDTRAQLTFLKSRLIDEPDVEQYRPRLIEVAPGHLVAEHDEF